MIIGSRPKQPADRKDYPISYTDWLAENAPGDTLASAIAAVECLNVPSDTSLVVASVGVSAQTVSPFLTGGTSGCRYKVTVTVTTAASPPRVDQCEFIINVKDT